jgi:hypothetical protein
MKWAVAPCSGGSQQAVEALADLKVERRRVQVRA